MNIKDAARLLNMSGTVTAEDIKNAYRRAAKQYHPDRNPAGAEMMKLINSAYDLLKDFNGCLPEYETQETAYPDALNDALNAIAGLSGLEIEVCGAWVWVSGNTKEHKEVLKTTGFKYASKKKRWYFRPEDWSSRSRGNLSMEDIREKYGSNKPNARGFRQIQAKQ